MTQELNIARNFCKQVGDLAKLLGLDVFVVTDGASLTLNTDNKCIKLHREVQKEWELQNGYNPNEDWSE